MWGIRCLVIVLLISLGGCPPQERLVLIPPSQSVKTPPPIREACLLTEQKCSRCHDLERIKVAHHALVDWPLYVDKMRRQPGSGITIADTKVIVQCLNYLSMRQREGEAYAQ
jgi:hypothetical protein